MDIKAVEEAIDDIIRYSRGELHLTVTKIALPPIDVPSIRENLGLSQHDFARRFGIPLRLLQDWEEERAQPDWPSRALLEEIKRDPDYVDREYAEYLAEQAAKASKVIS